MATINFDTYQLTGQQVAPTTNYGGLEKSIYIAYYEDLDVVPDNVSGTTTQAIVTTTTQPTLKAGKYFTKFACDFESPRLNLASLTSTPRMNADETSVQVYTVGYDEATIGLILNLRNQDLFVICKDNNGNMFFLGRAGSPAGIKTDGLAYATGTVKDGENKFDFVLYTLPKPFLKYVGTAFDPDTLIA
jgi:hypothetical protein